MGTKHANFEIEALRAFAVLFVIVEHINTLLVWRQGNHEDLFDFSGGVDLFFCISGFVITSAFGAEIAAAAAAEARSWRRAAAAFWVRRVFRILPLSWTVFVATAALALFHESFYGNVFHAQVFTGMIGDLAAIVFNVQNIHYGSCVGSTHPYCGSYFGIYWSLSLEEQFYLVFPFLFLLPRRLMMAALVGIVVLFALLPFPRTTMVSMTRLDAIAFGVLLAMVTRSGGYMALRPSMLRHPLLRVATLIALLLALCMVLPTAMRFSPSLVSLIALALVWIASYDAGYLMAQGRVCDGLVWIGQRSFAIYLIHNPVFWLVRWGYGSVFPGTPAGPAETLPFLLAAAMLLAALADLSFRFLETPLRRFGKQVAVSITAPAVPTEVTASSLA